jgi:hypothetical protein
MGSSDSFRLTHASAQLIGVPCGGSEPVQLRDESLASPKGSCLHLASLVEGGGGAAGSVGGGVGL